MPQIYKDEVRNLRKAKACNECKNNNNKGYIQNRKKAKNMVGQLVGEDNMTGGRNLDCLILHYLFTKGKKMLHHVKVCTTGGRTEEKCRSE